MGEDVGLAIFSRGLVGPGTPMQSYGANTRIANSSKLLMHVTAEATWETGSLENGNGNGEHESSRDGNAFGVEEVRGQI